MIVVDTSVLIDFLLGRRTKPAEHFTELEERGIPFAIPGVCCQELLAGAKNEREWKILVDRLSTQRVLYPAKPWEASVSAARIYFDCRKKGLSVRSSADCLIAQIVLEIDGTLLHDDDDFERIARVRPLRTIRE